jgi:uncharacterized membrane protein YcgQ (UPF0703/DUF1980 family)
VSQKSCVFFTYIFWKILLVIYCINFKAILLNEIFVTSSKFKKIKNKTLISFSIRSLISFKKCVLDKEMLNVVSPFCFTAVSSTRPGMDSTSCILVEDARAVAQDEEPRDVTSSQSPTEGKYVSYENIALAFNKMLSNIILLVFL